jgi:imidazolonepropionase-like amidohydrolase
MAHAFGGEGVDDAIDAGVRSIEHGMFLTEEQAHRMPRLAAGSYDARGDGGRLRARARRRLALALARKALDLEPLVGEAVSIARAAGVRIALGTDNFPRGAHGRNLRELALMRRAGLTAQKALLAATRAGAELCGVDGRYGRLAAGYVFDAILLDEDPSDTRAFERPDAVTGVFKAGAPMMRHPRLVEAAPLVVASG